MLKIENLCKSYKNFKALDNYNLTVNNGEILGFVGPNGAGKTTTIKIMAGLLKADYGKVLYNDINILENVNIMKEKIGYMPDFFGIYDNLKVYEYLEFYSSTYGIDEKNSKIRCEELLDLVGLYNKIDEYVDSLSRGMQQRLCLARTLIHNPEIIVLDEPASGLDPRMRHDLKEILKTLSDKGKTILISSHILTELSEMCTNIGIIEHGKNVMQGSMEEIFDKVDASNPLVINVLDRVEDAMSIMKNNMYVSTVSCDGLVIMASFVGRRQEEVQLLKELIEHDIPVVTFKREQSNLESLFLKITTDSKQ